MSADKPTVRERVASVLGEHVWLSLDGQKWATCSCGYRSAITDGPWFFPHLIDALDDAGLLRDDNTTVQWCISSDGLRYPVDHEKAARRGCGADQVPQYRTVGPWRNSLGYR